MPQANQMSSLSIVVLVYFSILHTIAVERKEMSAFLRILRGVPACLTIFYFSNNCVIVISLLNTH